MNEDSVILFAGDSMIEYFPLGQYFKRNILNRGIAGDTTAGLLSRISQLDTESKAISKTFLLIGTNDLAMGLAPEGVASNIYSISEKVKDTYGCEQVYIISILPVNYDDEPVEGSSLSAGPNAKIQKTNSLLRKFCEKNSPLYIDAATNFIDQNNTMNTRFTVEGLHLNTNGYSQLASVLKPFIV